MKCTVGNTPVKTAMKRNSSWHKTQYNKTHMANKKDITFTILQSLV